VCDGERFTKMGFIMMGGRAAGRARKGGGDIDRIDKGSRN
jgi:hypothetical protein